MAKLIEFKAIDGSRVCVNPERLVAARPVDHGTELWFGGDDRLYVSEWLDAVALKILEAA